MKWFSHDWHEGRMSDVQAEEVGRNYLAHCRAIRPRLEPESLALLALDVHDGRVLSYAVSDGGFTWRLLVGDQELGYEQVTLTYSQAEVVGGLDDLDSLDLLAPSRDLLFDELELLEDGRMEHRILVWPEGEIWVRFKGVHIHRASATPAKRRR